MPQTAICGILRMPQPADHVMNQTAPLFKFCSAAGCAAILRDKRIFVTSPLDLNDPFEMRPAWTDAHEERFHQDQQKRNDSVAGKPLFVALEGGNVLRSGTMPRMTEPSPIPVDNHRGTSDTHNQRVFEVLHKSFRILSLSAGILDIETSSEESQVEATLLWSHYADSFQGACIAIDPSKINNGIKPGGYPVDYSPLRSSLPPSFYDVHLQLERDGVLAENIPFTEDPDSEILLMRHNHEEKLRNQFITFLTQKSPAWKYEQEVRMIYDLPDLRVSADYSRALFPCKAAETKNAKCGHATFRDAIRLPAEAIRAVIFGTDTKGRDASGILQILASPNYAHVAVYWSSLHSDKYLLQYSKDDQQYVTFMQNFRASQIARAKGHMSYTAKGPEYLEAQKGTNYVINASGGP